MTSRRRAVFPADAAFRIIALAAVTALLALPSSAAAFDSTGPTPAAGQSPDNFSAGDQYVETLPSTKGPKPADGNRRKNVRLPHKIEQKLLGQGGSEAAKLTQIATSTQLGAPDQTLKKGKDGGAKSAPAVPSAAIDAVGGGQAGLGMLVIWLMVITAVALGAVAYRRYRNRDSSD